MSSIFISRGSFWAIWWIFWFRGVGILFFVLLAALSDERDLEAVREIIAAAFETKKKKKKKKTTKKKCNL